MLKNENLKRTEVVDLKEELAVTNPQYTPLSSIVLKKALVKAKDVEHRQTYRVLSENASGGRKEGGVAPESEKSTREVVKNYLEIFSKATSVSGTAAAIYGDDDSLLVRELNDRLIEIKYDIEKSFTVGAGKDEDETTGRKMNGLVNQVHKTHVVDAEAAELATANIDKAMQFIYTAQAPGERYIFINPADIGKFAELYTKQENAKINLTPGNDAVGIAVNKVITNFGTASVVMSNAIPAATILVTTLDQAEVAYEVFVTRDGCFK